MPFEEKIAEKHKSYHVKQNMLSSVYKSIVTTHPYWLLFLLPSVSQSVLGSSPLLLPLLQSSNHITIAGEPSTLNSQHTAHFQSQLSPTLCNIWKAFMGDLNSFAASGDREETLDERLLWFWIQEMSAGRILIAFTKHFNFLRRRFRGSPSQNEVTMTMDGERRN